MGVQCAINFNIYKVIHFLLLYIHVNKALQMKDSACKMKHHFLGDFLEDMGQFIQFFVAQGCIYTLYISLVDIYIF